MMIFQRLQSEAILYGDPVQEKGYLNVSAGFSVRFWLAEAGIMW